VESPADLEQALRSAFAARSPALIEVTTGPMSNVWPVIGPAGGVYPIFLNPPAMSS
jgi:thiamine pyrophosphate-dependent acetolactate synthase large subunit-like protein